MNKADILNSLIGQLQELTNEDLENLPNKDLLVSLTQSLKPSERNFNFGNPVKN